MRTRASRDGTGRRRRATRAACASSVVLPEPDGPVTTSRCPGARMKLTGRSLASVTKSLATSRSGDGVNGRGDGASSSDERTLGVLAPMELDAEATHVREDLAGDQDGDERVRERDPPAEQREADDHRDESDADPAQELGDQRRLQRHANRAHRDGVLGVRDRGDLVGAVVDRAEGAQFGRVVEELELTALQDGATFLVLERASPRFARPARR